MRTTLRVTSVVLGVLAAVGLAGPALAHVSVEVDNARPGATGTYAISVPNESDTADTITIEVQLPEGLEVTDTRPGKGWEMAVDGGVLVIEGGAIPPGERREFRFVAANPLERGTLTFPAIQTYSDGEEVRWVGETGSDRPAGQVEITGKPVAQEPEPTETEQAAPSGTPTTESPTATEPARPAPSETAAPQTEETSSSVTPAIAVVLAVVVTIVIMALLRRRAARR